MTEKPLNEYIDLDVYDVVTGEAHRAILARVQELETVVKELREAICSALTITRGGQTCMPHPHWLATGATLEPRETEDA